MAEDIVDELEADGTALSLRAARYIRIKRHTEEGLRESLSHMCQRSLEHERQGPTGDAGG